MTVTWLVVAACALTACSHDSRPTALTSPTGANAPSIGAASTAGVSGTAGSTLPSAGTLAPGAKSSTAKGTPKSASGGGHYDVPNVVAPVVNSPSGVICNYVTQSEVNTVLPGVPVGQENDLATVAVSYCYFGSESLGSVTVGVKNFGTASAAGGTVRQQWAEMSPGPDQSTRTFTAAGGFAFEVGSTTHPPNGSALYALNAQGSRGAWYVSIQYYAHQAPSTGAMQQLLATVLSHVPG